MRNGNTNTNVILIPNPIPQFVHSFLLFSFNINSFPFFLFFLNRISFFRRIRSAYLNFFRG
ncbi:hypothetical protein BDV28DRAFT_130480 [Aspergillus coremiiformis]|uniref:Uncharacterized protein n=1 Tax=Aspergillus coremiiformis TaxID=138285 RepID=A0A5N6ZAL2_9EURO|nr:hypothetical protein BDV28DRAFT_130480 [Aspergillus coremiiformis]